jgi:pimeloyl-ACP methyl ester carboxylesterase
MTALWLRRLLLAQLALLVFAGAVLAAFGHEVEGILLALFGLPLAYLVLTGLHVALLSLWCARHAAPCCAGAARARIWMTESWLQMRAFMWLQPWRAQARPDSPGTPQNGPGVVLVHGYLCNRGFWNPLLARLEAQGTPWVAVNLEPMFGDIAAYAPTIDAAVTQLAASTGRAPVVLAHSMGGLAARAWLAEDATHAQRVAAVVTVGSPHGGTWIARWGATFNAWQMRPASPWLRSLQSRESHMRQPPIWCVSSACDQLVYPEQAALLPGALPVHVAKAGHLGLAFDPATWAALDAALRLASGRTHP